jgi:hypothetical protein
MHETFSYQNLKLDAAPPVALMPEATLLLMYEASSY